MAKSNSKMLENLVNASGFAFQLAVEHAIRSSGDLDWLVSSREHAWHHRESGAEGFIDLVIESGLMTWVLECKRSKDATWIFLVENQQKLEVTDVRCLWIAGTGNSKPVAGWDDLKYKPASPESDFCIIRGTGEGARSLLERLSSQLSISTDSLADEHIRLSQTVHNEFSGIFVPAIVTNATLQICRVDPNKISLTEGTIKDGEFEVVPMVRFRKAFSCVDPPNASANSLEEASQMRKRTVLVINSSNLIKILKDVEMLRDILRKQLPWERYFNKLKNK